ncbi:MAG: transcription termination/antitermination protein NusA [Erysipelotrichaceae bacterium]|nr:transcription termination/antitermination protein NusA [Erysipelotrichaceae bacterium]
MSGINLKSKEFLDGLRMFEEDRKVDPEFVLETLKEAIIRTYQKHIDAPAAQIRVEVIDNKMRVFHDFLVVDDESDSFDETLDILYSEAKKIKPDVQVGDTITQEVDFNEIGRSSISVAKNMLKQRIKEFEKQKVYDEYKDKEYDLISGIVKTAEEKFVLIDIKNTIGIMTKPEQIPGEEYREGQTIRVIIKEVSKNSKGSQVILSRSDPMFVKRLFEKEVPEIAQGIVEIKAIAREAGERTKMAVYSRNEDVDPIGACIGPRGTRVQAVISEIRGEKIDVFEWNDDLGELVRYALSPAEIRAVFYAEDKDEKEHSHYNRPLTVVVNDDQLSVAIGKKGKNARLAVKLTGRKIDIKTISDIVAEGIDIDAKMQEFKEDQERLAKEKEMRQFLAQQEEAKRRQEEFESQLAQNDTGFAEEAIEEMAEQNPAEEEVTIVELAEEKEAAKKAEETVAEEPKAEKPAVEETKAEEPVREEVKAEPAEEKKPERKKAVLTPKADTYVSKLEKFADASSKQEEQTAKKKKKRKGEEDERRLRAKDLDNKEYEIRPEYTEEELEEIALQQEEEEQDSWINEDIDFDEYEDYYDDEE